MTDSEVSLRRRGLYLEYLAVIWNVVEAGVGIWSGVVASSIALIGFGFDSAIEVFAALVVIWQLYGVNEDRKRRALRSIAVSFFLLGAYVAGETVRPSAGDSDWLSMQPWAGGGRIRRPLS